MPRIEKGDTVVIEREVTRVLDERTIVIRLPGVDTPVQFPIGNLLSVKKERPPKWKPPRDMPD
ncbi:hypothetical protein [Aminobacter sp. BE322]|uniref:hypothetical protein n=1 Tax=unclassified Aminobacter TaxID=2644704 RepID=UPI003D232D04